MFCGVIASWKLEFKCKRLLWTEYWYSKLFRLLWKFLNITDVCIWLMITHVTGMKNLEKREVRSQNKVR